MNWHRSILLTILVSGLSVADTKKAPALKVQDQAGQVAELTPKRLTLVNFWATWCTACKLEIVEYNKILPSYSNKLDYWFISLDSDPNKPKIEFPKLGPKLISGLYIDPSLGTADQVGVTGFPATVILGSKGEILRVYNGYTEANMHEIEKFIKAYK